MNRSKRLGIVGTLHTSYYALNATHVTPAGFKPGSSAFEFNVVKRTLIWLEVRSLRSNRPKDGGPAGFRLRSAAGMT